MMQHEVQRMQIGQLISLDFAMADSCEVFPHALGGNFTHKNRIMLRSESNQADIGVVALVTGAGMRDLTKLDFHFSDHAGVTPIMRAYAISCPICSLA